MKKVLVPIVVALIVAASLILVANIGANTALSIKNKGYVTVKGFAKQDITSDLGIFEATITAENPDLKLSYATLAADKGKVESFITSKYGITDNEIELEPASISEIYKINERGYNTDEFVKYILRQNIKIESNNVQNIAKLSAGIVDILDEGVKLTVSYPQYIYTGLDDLKIEMIGRATDNARQRALKIAKEGKFKLGPIASVRVGIFQITPKNSTEISNYGMNDTSSIDKEIKSVVEIQYFVK
jgi:hypothetical protein